MRQRMSNECSAKRRRRIGDIEHHLEDWIEMFEELNELTPEEIEDLKRLVANDDYGDE